MCDGLLSVRQVWQIHEPFEFTEEEQIFLVANPLAENRKWKDNTYKPLKDRIREHYLGLQNCTCAYCRLPLNSGTDSIEIEHIIDKNRREDFTFEPLNLVVSCHNCNFTKSKKRVLHNCPPPNQYPEDETAFKIIHGHYDDYFLNIEFREGSIYHALTDKGEFTISTCGLDRTPLAEQREEIEMYHDDPLIAKVVELRKSGNNEALLNDIMKQLNNLK
jgi:uncharacterized protein (TIGR02646 family)